MDFKAKYKFPYFQIFINDLIHLQFIKSKYIAHEAYKEGTSLFVIKYYLEGKNITCEYDSFEKWENIIKLLEKEL